jgi:methylase of polypeptide subunit release factors
MDALPGFQPGYSALAEKRGTFGSSSVTADESLIELGRSLRDAGYRFTTVTPLTHRRVLKRPDSAAVSLTDVFGWSRPFRPSDLRESQLRLLQDADALIGTGDRLRSAVRFSTLGKQLFIHSAFPTEEGDAVFFGPDTYRFVRKLNQLIIANLGNSPARILDVGAGSGAGGLHAASLVPHATSVVLSDINRRALRFCRINAALNGLVAEVIESDLYDAVRGSFDLIISNPPYLVDPFSRLYRHGGGEFGEGLSLAFVAQGIDRLAPGGRLLLYTGTTIVGGVDQFQEMMNTIVSERAVRLTYEEIDPDVFGEELEHPPYDRADRIAVVAVTVESSDTRRGYS